LITDRIFGAEDPVPVRPLEQLAERVDRLHQPHAVLLGGEPLVHLEERDDLLLGPQVPRRRDTLHVPLHGLLEQDRPRMREPSNAGSVITRVRIAWTRSNISSSEEYRLSSMP
jgi:hypothetical protein